MSVSRFRTSHVLFSTGGKAKQASHPPGFNSSAWSQETLVPNPHKPPHRLQSDKDHLPGKKRCRGRSCMRLPSAARENVGRGDVISLCSLKTCLVPKRCLRFQRAMRDADREMRITSTSAATPLPLLGPPLQDALRCCRFDIGRTTTERVSAVLLFFYLYV